MNLKTESTETECDASYIRPCKLCVIYKMRYLNIPGVTAALSAFIESNLKLPLT